MVTPLCGAVKPLLYPRYNLRQVERSPTGRFISFPYSHPESVVSPVGGTLYAFHNALHVSDPPGEIKPLTFNDVLPTGSAWRFRLW